jgi:TBC1 domain family protein 5
MARITTTHVHMNIGGQLDMKPYVTPIVEDCNRIQSNFLRTTDPLLWKHMQAAGIEPQIYGMRVIHTVPCNLPLADYYPSRFSRWLRLVFTREFSMKDSMKLWDGLFACDPTFELALWLCVAMLIRIRNECEHPFLNELSRD